MTENCNFSSNKNYFGMVRSKYILGYIFNNIPIVQRLNAIRYNKNFQKKLNIDIKDYIREYLKIGIELVPEENKYGKFLNIKYKKYCHIFFNNNIEEIKRVYITTKDEIKKIKIFIDYEIKSLNELFKGCVCIKSINFFRFNRTNIEIMSGMFLGCCNLRKINCSKFHTDNVTDMGRMFEGCSALEQINLDKFSTSNVTDMRRMFYNCISLNKILNISRLNTI